jgi:two-component sensor histidine kinase
MTGGGANSERVLILAPLGRDAEIASMLLVEAGRQTHICTQISELCDELDKGAALALVTEEAVAEGDILLVAEWVSRQPPWSDLPILLLTAHGDNPARVERASQFQDILGNVTYLERPFHSTTLVNLVRSAIRSRRRQYEARASLERYILLARELQHRTKNLLAVIQSIASASLAAGPARETYFSRLHALATAQDLVMEGDGRGTSIKRLVEQALESFGERISIDGPDTYLSATTAQGFALILHELATNAAKHGSLIAPGGTIAVQWRQLAGPPSVLVFTWRERGGPPASPPRRKGFGTKLLELAVASAGAPRFAYSSEGFEYELTAVLDRNRATANTAGGGR